MIVPVTLVRPAYRLYQLAWAGLDWLYPPTCGGCGKPGSRWCSDCQRSTQILAESICQRCGKILGDTGFCASCRDYPPPYTALRSWADYGGSLRQAILRLKYRGDISLGEILARPMLRILKSQGWQLDLVTPVPSGIARKAKRGYNQAALLALPLALGAGIHYRAQALIKRRETPSQVGLLSAQRWKNVVGSFQARREFVEDRSVLVVDDVTTSGATMHACALALLEAGTSRVYGLTLARAEISTVQMPL